MTAARLALPCYEWNRMPGEESRHMRLLPAGYFITASASGFWRCSACNAWGRSLDDSTARFSADSHVAQRHPEGR